MSKWQIWFQTPEMVVRSHTQAGRVFRYRDRAESEAAKIAARPGWTAVVRERT